MGGLNQAARTGRFGDQRRTRSNLLYSAHPADEHGGCARGPSLRSHRVPGKGRRRGALLHLRGGRSHQLRPGDRGSRGAGGKCGDQGRLRSVHDAGPRRRRQGGHRRGQDSGVRRDDDRAPQPPIPAAGPAGAGCRRGPAGARACHGGRPPAEPAHSLATGTEPAPPHRTEGKGTEHERQSADGSHGNRETGSEGKKKDTKGKKDKGKDKDKKEKKDKDGKKKKDKDKDKDKDKTRTRRTRRRARATGTQRQAKAGAAFLR